MTISIGECPLGVFAFNEEGDRITSKPFPQDVREISGRLSLIREDKLTEEHMDLVEELLEEGYSNFRLESDKIASQLRESFVEADFEVEVPNLANEILRESVGELAGEFGFENVNKIFRDVNIIMTRGELRKEASERDKIVIQSINAIDELDKTTNTLYGRITEWYGIHFPEFERYISDHPEYLRLISCLGNRKNFEKDNLIELGIDEELAEEIQDSAEESIGAEFDEIDIEAIQKTSERIQTLQSAREDISDYLEGLMEQVAPNISALVGGLIGARLISLAGGLDDLAKMPSSTIQVLGAEKALFRSLHKNAKPPKHGVIFQYPEIRGSPRSLRGKIARALAGKLAIAAKIDAMSGKYRGDELKDDLEERIASIKSEG